MSMSEKENNIVCDCCGREQSGIGGLWHKFQDKNLCDECSMATTFAETLTPCPICCSSPLVFTAVNKGCFYTYLHCSNPKCAVATPIFSGRSLAIICWNKLKDSPKYKNSKAEKGEKGERETNDFQGNKNSSHDG